MTSEEATIAAIRTLNSFSVPFMIVGSLSSNYYGVARATHDADFVVELGDVSLTQIASKLGPDLRLDPQITFESVTGTTRYRFELTGQDYTIEVFLLSGDAHDRQRFERRVRTDMYGEAVYIPTPEDVIVMKLRWYSIARRRKDRDDIVNMLIVQRDRIDLAYIRSWAEQHGSIAKLEELLGVASNPNQPK